MDGEGELVVTSFLLVDDDELSVTSGAAVKGAAVNVSYLWDFVAASSGKIDFKLNNYDTGSH